MSGHFELFGCESTLLREVGDSRIKQKDVAVTYALALRSSDAPNWATVNRAIMKRWSFSGLERIKKLAWKVAAAAGGNRQEPQ